MELLEVIEECLPDIRKTRAFFSELVQLRKMDEELREFRPHLIRIILMIEMGHLEAARKELHLFGDELTDFFSVAIGVIDKNPELDAIMVDQFRFKTQRTSKRLDNNEYGEDGVWIHATDAR